MYILIMAESFCERAKRNICRKICIGPFSSTPKRKEFVEEWKKIVKDISEKVDISRINVKFILQERAPKNCQVILPWQFQGIAVVGFEKEEYTDFDEET